MKLINLFLLVMLPCICVANNNLVKKSICTANGEDNYRYFYYDSLNRLIRLEEYGPNERLISISKHTYDGLVETDSTYYEGGSFAIITIYTDSTFKYIARQYVPTATGAVEEYTDYTYDDKNRLILSISGNQQGIYKVNTYQYTPYKCKGDVDWQSSGRKLRIRTTYYDEDCTLEKKSVTHGFDKKIVEKHTYDSQNRLLRFTRRDGKKLTQDIRHTYIGNIETITNMGDGMIIDFY